MTLWPSPESYTKPDVLFFCPGELKALAIINAGLPATSMTSGESGKITDEIIRRLKKVAAKKIVLVYDDDAPKMRGNGDWFSPGHEWRDELLKRFEGKGMAVEAITLKPKDLAAMKEDPKVEIDPCEDWIEKAKGKSDTCFMCRWVVEAWEHNNKNLGSVPGDEYGKKDFDGPKQVAHLELEFGV